MICRLNMNTQQLKLNLINVINQTENPVLLLEMTRLANMNLKDDSIIQLLPEQIDEIERAINQIDKGEYYTHDEAKELSDKWLKD